MPSFLFFFFLTPTFCCTSVGTYTPLWKALRTQPPSPPPPSRSIRLGKGGTLRQMVDQAAEPTRPGRRRQRRRRVQFSWISLFSISLDAVAAATSDFRCAVPIRRGGPQKRQRRATPWVGRVALGCIALHATILALFSLSLFPQFFSPLSPNSDGPAPFIPAIATRSNCASDHPRIRMAPPFPLPAPLPPWLLPSACI